MSKNSACLCCIQRFQSISDGCQVTFLNGILEEVYMQQLDGFVDKNNKNMVCRLHKALYGLSQATKTWYERLHTYLVKIGFERIDDNNNLYMKIDKNNTQSLVPRPEDKNVIGTKWVFRNKLDENGEVTRNKARLVCKGYA